MVWRVLELVGGVIIVLGVVSSAVRTLLVPKGLPSGVSRAVFLVVRKGIKIRVRGRTDPVVVDNAYTWYAPLALLALPATWLALTLVSFMLFYKAVEDCSWGLAFRLSGSSLTTLGSFPPATTAGAALSFVQASLGVALLALMITYLPTIYSAFQRREARVTLLETLAGSPPAAETMLIRAARIGEVARIDEFWRPWEEWFADVQESHTTMSSVCFFRSAKPENSWITACGAVLDAAAFRAAVVDIPGSVDANLCLRAGYLCLRSIAGFFHVPQPMDPDASDPISVTRAEWDAVVDRLAEAGVPVKPDRDQAWKDWSGWRVNYDAALRGICAVVVAPPAVWSGDRPGSFQRPPIVFQSRARKRLAAVERHTN